MGDITKGCYEMKAFVVDVEEWCTDAAEVIQKERVKLDLGHMCLMQEAFDLGMGADALRRLFMSQWENFSQADRERKWT
jgi:hypothetical protein